MVDAGPLEGVIKAKLAPEISAELALNSRGGGRNGAMRSTKRQTCVG
jgi:hypothetical protein